MAVSTVPQIPNSPFSSHHRHILSQRTYIPANVYEHPAALLLERCSSLKDLRHILPLVFKNGLYQEHLFQTKLVSLFCRYGSVVEAARVFDPIDDKLDVLYHTMLKGYAKVSDLDEAVNFFVRMRYDDVEPIVYNFTYLLKVCGDEADLRMGKEIHGIGKEIHGYATRAGFDSLVNISTALVDMYAECGSLKTARLLFDGMLTRNVVSWNSMIDAYVQNENPNEAITVFQKMLDEGVKPTDVSVMGALHACADLGDLERGRFIHKLSVELDLDRNVSVVNSLISMYCKCKEVDTAASMFEKLQTRTLVSWNAMILGFAQNGRPIEALNYFSQMRAWTVKPDTFTYVSVITALAELSVAHHANSVSPFMSFVWKLISVYRVTGPSTETTKLNH
ncbi:unnamed protein product [Thlaspi arvense]|uniref:Pentatricopeptide repeat-containing protein n=1 Tax=Thlaspi arvense TaxID=13288 RepID=A0AAU9RCS7_THLAR|nr:unnamed protein product [Thlaspi arvense]